MVEKGKRSYSRPHKDYDGDNRNQKRRVNDRDERGDGELIVYRILCPDRVIGSVIGKSGKIINSIRQESRAKVKVVDPFPGANDRVLTIYCYVNDKVDLEVDDEFNDTEALCAAQQALLMVHTAISNAVASIGDSDKKQRDDECQLLVPISQSANIIGKSGSTIKKLRSKTRTNIRVTSKDASDPKHSCAMHFDNFIQINGESDAVKKALFAISAIMYKFGPKENISLDTSVPEVPPTIIISSDVPVYPAAGFYPGVDSIVNPRSLSSILGATHVPELQGYADTEISWPGYSSSVPVVSRYGGASRSEELIIRVLCSFSKIGRVIGKGGASIKSVRNASGARVGVDDKKTDHNECTITVTATEKLDDVKSMAVEAVLLLQEKINDEDADTVSIRLLIPSKVIGCIIGKNGSIINEIRKRTKADIRISKGDKPKCADDDDELVEVFGEVGSVRDALVQIVLRLRDDVLKDREVNQNPSDGVGLRSLYPGSTAFSVPPVLPGIPPVGLLGYEQRGDTGSGLNMVTSDSLYRYESLPTGDSSYGSLSSPYSSKLYGGLPRATALEMVVPAHALGKVMGKGGANLDNIRKGDKIVDDVCPNMPLDDSSFDFKLDRYNHMAAWKWFRSGRSLLGGLNSNSLGLLRMSPETTCCDLLSQQTRTFIQMGTKLKVADNSGAKLVKCIQALKGKKGARLGDMIVASVKEAAPGGTVKKGAVVYAVVVRAAMPRGRCDGSEVKFDDNACVLVNKQGEPIGKRVHGPVPHELRKKKHIKILSLAEHIA